MKQKYIFLLTLFCTQNIIYLPTQGDLAKNPPRRQVAGEATREGNPLPRSEQPNDAEPMSLGGLVGRKTERH